MGRSRVLSFMTTFGSNKDSSRDSPSPQPYSKQLQDSTPTSSKEGFSSSKEQVQTPDSPTSSTPSPTPPTTRTLKPSSRPGSMILQPSMMDTSRDTLPELLPIFQYLNSHGNKLYQEGYFLKLNDLDTNGKPNVDRNWTECFAQLVGTVLSLWDAAALDAAGQDGEVAPTFVNLADASIKMIETLPTRNHDVQPLQNVLSISTAGMNRYLLHFNSLHSLTQWTAGIRLAMFEHASLQEHYTGSLIAGKGKALNNIRTIMERTRLRQEDWARVRFGAGTPWRRCWCVVEPPDEKDYQKLQRSMKKKSAYDRTPVLKGDIKFYDTKKTKKVAPIATITDAYSAYAIYPQAKPLIDQSTLVKVEGRITIHSKPESKTEGFVFVMPEAHPAVTGFEMMLRWLFPVYDVFNLYGRPNTLISDTMNTKGLMFAMPKQRRYGYLEIIDVAGLIHTEGSKDWSEREWRKHLKELVKRRMDMMRATPSRDVSRTNNMGGHRTSLPSRPGNLRIDDTASIRLTPSAEGLDNQSTDASFATPRKSGNAPPGAPFPPPTHNYHARAVSESVAFPSPTRRQRQKDSYKPSRLSIDQEAAEPQAPPPPPLNYRMPYQDGRPSLEVQSGRNSSESDHQHAYRGQPDEIRQEMQATGPPRPVAAPPAFEHRADDTPKRRPNAPYEMRRANNRMSSATLSQMIDASGMRPVNGEAPALAGAAAAWKTRNGRAEEQGSQGVMETPANTGCGTTADQSLASQGMVGSAADDSNMAQRRQDLLEPLQDKAQRSASQQSIVRKPLPSPTSAVDEGVNAAAKSTDLEDGHVGHGGNAESRETPEHARPRQIESKTAGRSESRPRSGVWKTVGNSTSNEDEIEPSTTGLPHVDFGPTQITGVSTSRPVSPGPDFAPTKRPSHELLRSSSTPLDIEKRTSFNGKYSPDAMPISRPSQSRTPSSDKRNSILWQPGTVATPGSTPGQAITPEQYVHQRVSANRANPQRYAPQRSRSSGYFWVDRPASGEWSKKEVPSRPQSRGPSPLLDFNAPQDYSSRLSAREQEHIARMTNSPLLGMPQGREQVAAQVGLVGAIQARELEKKGLREGVSSQMVQHAIQQRHQRAHAAQAQVEMQARQAHAQQAAQMAYGYNQYQPNIYNGNAPSISSAAWSPQSQAGQSGQWTGQRLRWAGGEANTGSVPLQQTMPFQQSRPYNAYYGPQGGPR